MDKIAKKNGLYVHYSFPKCKFEIHYRNLSVLDIPAVQLRQWNLSGADSKLERAILSGQGHRLLAEAVALPLPQHLLQLIDKCNALHAAVEKGSLLELKELLDTDYNHNKCVTCYDEAGVGLIHKAVFYNYIDIMEWLVKSYPYLVHQRDSEGRTALHYTAACRDEAAAAALLQRAGAARGARDAAGRTLAHYRAARTLLALPAADMPQPARNNPPAGLVIKRHNIRIWCHECDMGKLQRVVWEGHGTRLLSEVSSQPVVKRFLEAVPYIMNTIRDIHNAVIQNDLEGVMKLTADPVPPRVLSSWDVNSMTAFHKAAGLGHCGILKCIIEKYPQGINEVDCDGRTPLHYAATVKDEQHTYNTLVGLGADESIVDNKNKTPGYYINRPQEIDKNSFKTLPDAPRTPSSAYPSSWDWKLLDADYLADLNKKSRKKNLKASNENISSKNTTSILSETFEHQPNTMKVSSTHELISTLPELDDIEKSYLNEETKIEEDTKNEENTKIEEDTKMKEDTKIYEDTKHKASEVTEANNVLEEYIGKEKNISNTTELFGECDNNSVSNTTNNENHFTGQSVNMDGNSEENLLLNTENTKVNASNMNVMSGPENEKKISSDRKEVELQNDNHAEIPDIDQNEKKIEKSGKQNDNKHNVATIEKNENHENDENYSEKLLKESHLNAEKQTDIKNDIIDLEEFVQTEPLNRDQENVKVSDERKTSNGENLDSKFHAKSSDGKTGEKDLDIIGQNTDTIEEGNNNTDNFEDDDDVQIQEKSHLEHNDMEFNGSAEVSQRNSARRGNLINGRNTQENLIEGIISGDAEEDLQDASMTQKDGSVHGDILIVDSEIDSEVTELINSANMEMLATLVLNGEGSRLIGRCSQNAELLAFLENVPTYMQKINRVHIASREGNIRDLQTALDRRKFAIARDPISPNGATPLHVATVFGKTNIIKYLGGRFPETLSAVDFEGRTALHYAAVIPDNGHFYNLLQQLGANSKDLDDNGQSAEDYLNNPNLLPHEQLLTDYGISEEVAKNMLADKGKNHAVNSHMDIPVFHTEEGRYLAKSLGDPLIKGLTEVANVKPKDPVAFLASFLHNFPDNEKPRLNTQESNTMVTSEAPEVENDYPPPQRTVAAAQSTPGVRSAARTATRPHRPIDVIALDPKSEISPDAPENAFSSVNRDEHGQSMLHFAAARTHANNALFQLLRESDVSLGYRDELYRTARDVSIQANVPENTVEIDKWLLHLAARGESDTIMELLLLGYDHILDIKDENGVYITQVISQRGDTEMSNLLTSIPAFEDSRESLHEAVRRGDLSNVRDIVSTEGGHTLARAHNSFGRTALHVAVLAQHEDIVAYLADTCPELLRIGDNLERTPLHYAMGVEKIESLSRVLIKAGAKRVLKDLKGRQPTYYFMNKSDILRLKEEEEAY